MPKQKRTQKKYQNLAKSSMGGYSRSRLVSASVSFIIGVFLIISSGSGLTGGLVGANSGKIIGGIIGTTLFLISLILLKK